MRFDFGNVPTLESQMSVTAKMAAPVFLSLRASYFYRPISSLFVFSLTSILRSIIFIGYSGKPDGMIQLKHNNSGTVAVTMALLIIIALGILSIARHFWADSANEHFDRLISVYITEKEDLNEDDRDRLRTQLLEDGIFIKMNRWNKESFVKDRQLYNEMIITRDQRQMRKEDAEDSVIETMINL